MATTEALILEKPSDPNVLARTPGVYVAPSSSPSYGVLRGLVVAGVAQLLGETYLEDGRQELMVEVGRMRANAPDAEEESGSMTMGHRFFIKAFEEYRDWREKWWREAIQNAVDAGARKVDCLLTLLDADGKPTDEPSIARTVQASCEDNGKGMDRDTFVTKFMAFGETGKGEAESTSVGGFGEAKRLLLLPFIEWRVDTRNLTFFGQGNAWKKKPNPSPIGGTRLTVLMPVGQATTAADAQSFIRKSYIPNVQFTVNGSVVKATQKVGELVESLPGKLDIYYKSRSKDFTQAVCLVRVNGMYMFTRRIADEIKGVIIAEITGRSTDILYSNRDNIRDDTTADFLDRYINELAADTTTKLTPKQQDYAKYFEGTGKFKAESARMQREMLMQMGSVEPEDHGKTKPRTLSHDQAEALMRTIERHVDPQEEETQGRPLDLRPAPAMARAMIEVEVAGPEQVQAMAKQLSWEPDFLVYAPVKKDEWGSVAGERINVSVKFEPQKMTPGLRKLARFWAEMCRFVLLQLGSKEEYGVGWCFAEIGRGGFAAAMYMSLRGADWLLLNPYVRGNVEKGEFYSLANKEHVNALYAMAVHECTHMANCVGRHDEAFASALTWNVAKTANRGRQIEAIRKAVVARGAAIGKIGELGKPEPTRRGAEPPQSHRALEVLYTRMKQRGPTQLSEMDAEQAAAYALFGETNDDLAGSIGFAERREKVYRDYVERDGLTGYDKALDNWGAAVRILKALAESEKPVGPGGSNVKPYTRKELTDLFDSRNRELPYNRMSAEQAAATMLAYHELSEGIVQAEAKAVTFAGEADDARGHGDPSAREREQAAYAWQDASFILKALAEREGADVLVRAGKERAGQAEQESIDEGWATPNRRRR